MSGLWYVRVPEAATNYVLNPSAEMGDNFFLFAGGSPSVSPSVSPTTSPSGSASPSASQSRSPSASASPSASVSRSPSASASPSASVSPSPSPSAQLGSVTRVTTYARHGNWCYDSAPTAAFDGMRLRLGVLTNADHYVSLYYIPDTHLLSVEVSLNGTSFYAISTIGGRQAGWVRGGVSIPAAQANGSTWLYIRFVINSLIHVYVDAVQVEANDYGTTYIDGDLGDGYRWTGLRHGSTSTRSAQVRAGGRERNLLDDYAIEVVEGSKNIGTPPVVHQLADLSMLPGALYQGTKVLPREIELHLNYTVEDAGSVAATWSALVAKRAQVFDLFKPDAVRGGQPVTIGYAGPGSGNRVYADFHYTGGMEGFSDLLHVDEIAPIRLLAPDPYWRADDQETHVLDYQDLISSAFATMRIDGQWQTPGTGFNANVNAVAYDKQRGRLYFGGAFTTANGASINRVCYWDGSAFQSLGRGVEGGSVFALAVAPNGDLWVGGEFTTVGGSASQNYIARWNVATNTWTSFGAVVPTGIVYALAVDRNGLLYVGGNFTNWNANANADYVVTYNGSAWAALSTGLDGICYALTLAPNGSVYVGGAFANAGGGAASRVALWSGSAFSALGAGVNGIVRTLDASPGGELYVGGDFTTAGGLTAPYIAKWTGYQWVALGEASNNIVRSVLVTESGSVYASGDFTQIGGLSLTDGIAVWNGSAWRHLGVDTPGPNFLSMVEIGTDLCFVMGGDIAFYYPPISAVVNAGSASALMRLDVINQNTSGAAVLQLIENLSTDQHIYFDLSINPGESVVFDLANTRKTLVSNWIGPITDNPLSNSDVVNFRLLPGSNRITAFITGTVTSVVALMHWTPTYWSADGAA